MKQRLPAAQPTEDLVVEGVNNFDLVVVGVGNCYYVFLGDEAKTERMLQFRIFFVAVEVAVSMQVLWVLVSANQKARRL